MTEKCIICCVFESDTTPEEGFFLGLMCCVSKSEKYGVSPAEVWDRALASLCQAHWAAYEGVGRRAERTEVRKNGRESGQNCVYFHTSDRCRDALKAENARLREKIDREESEHAQTICERDMRETQLEEAHAAMGCEREASNLHDYGACILANIDACVAQAERSQTAEAETARLREALTRFDQLVEAAQTSHADDGYTDADVQVGKFQDELPALLALAATDQPKRK